MRLTIPGKPVPAARPRVTRRGTYYPTRYRDWLLAAGWIVHGQATERLSGPVRLSLVIGAKGIQVEVSPSGVLRPKGVRGDLDNLCKACLDALQAGGALADDAQVTEIVASFGGVT